MSTTQPIAIVGLGAILPDALNVQDFWQNLLSARYSISEVTKDRWDEALYYDSDPSVPDKTYSKIGGFVRGFRFEPLKMKLPIPPNVAAVMDEAQQWAIVASYQALQDYGYPQRSLDPERVAVIFGNSMAGEYHYRTNMRIFLPEYEQALASSEAFRQLTPEIQAAILEGFKSQIRSRIPNITEDTMPGELSNIIAGRVANLFNFSGPNFVTDAACASSFAALQAAIEGLQSYQFDAVLSGGIDRNMGVESYVKFCKIGALSPDGSRPYADGANGFVMGEGAVVFLLKRLADAEKDQDRIYAVIRGIGGSSDGKGKGITAPNPLGQQRAIERAWKNAALSPSTATLIEGHGTSTRVGDVVEVNTLNTVFSPFNLPTASIALGSVKSNIGHLKSAAGAAGLLKTVLSLYHKKLLPNANFHRPNPNLDFDRLPFYVLTTVKDWDQPKADIRRAGISSFGFGGTNFHLVVEEYLPGYALKGSSSYSGVALSVAPIQSASPAHVNAQTIPQSIPATQVQSASPSPAPQPANADIQATVLKLVAEKTGYPEDMLDLDLDLEADLGIDTVKQAELFATIRQHFGIPRREDLRLADYNTLAKVIQFMQEALSGSSPAQAPQPTTAPQTAQSASPSPAPQPANADIQATVLKLVAEKTGYPEDMLDLDLDLEADLGIDTVKQAELFATIRQHFGIPRREDLRLADYNTLAKVIQFMQEALSGSSPAQAPQPSPAPQAAQQASPSPAPQPANADIQATVLKLVAEKTGYPEDMLDLDLDLEADLGIDTVKQAELFATIRQHFGIPRREDLRLADYNTLAKVIQFMQEALSGSSPAQAPQPTAAAAISVEKATLPPSAPQASAQPRQRGLRGILFLSATDPQSLQQQCEQAINATRNGILPNQAPLSTHELSQPERLAIDYGSAEELIKRAEKALSAFENPSLWQNLTGQGIYRFSGSNKDHKVAFLFPGQGSQYANMLRDLFDVSSSVRDTYAEADAVMTPLLGKPLTDYIFCENTEEAIKAAEAELKNTIITQPAVLTANVALMRLLGEYNIHPDLVIGHSLGEYAALVAAGVLSFAEALEVVSARGREMSKVTVADNGTMAAISAPLEVVESTLKQIDGYIVIANINSPSQSVIAGETAAVASAIEAFQAAGYQAVKLSVSHAFHSKIVAPASEPLRKVIQRMHIHPPKLPIAANVTGDLYPNTVEEITDLLCQQIASPVQFIRGINTLYNHGARIFVEVGPKRVLSTLALEILKDKNDVYIFSTNHPRKGGIASFNEGLCGLYACGLPRQTAGTTIQSTQMPSIPKNTSIKYTSFPKWNGRLPLSGSVVISGAGLGLPGKAHHVFEDDNIQRLLNGEMRIDPLPEEIRREMVSLRITRLEKSESGAVMVPIESTNQVIKLAGQRGAFDLHQEFGIPQERVDALDITTQLAIAAGIEALRDAGIPLIMNFRKTSKGTYLPDRWMLPPALADETGVIFASAFPGLGGMAEELERYYTAQQIQAQISEISSLLDLIPNDNQALRENLLNRLAELEEQSKAHPYQFNRNFIFRVLTMGHSQFAEYIGARGPNTAVNAACATTTHALAIAEDWIRAGRCRRVIVIAGDDPTSGSIAPWISGGMFASGAATTEGNLRLAALPFDRRRNGMLMGMGAAALVVEAQEALVERGMTPICEILASVIANSAFHGTRLNIDHVSQVMDRVLSEAETRYGIKRSEIAPHTVFISHETYTPARGGSASAEIRALRYTFGDQADKVMIANTKGYTGHAMGVGIEDVLATKALEYQIVPPIAHINDGFEPDPELGNLNLSRGGKADVHYALRLGAGFGSQIAMSLMRKVGTAGQRIDHPRYQKWLSNISGYPNPTLEVVQHTLRIKNEGVPPQPPADSEWQYGQVPKAWALDVPPTADAFLAHSESIPSADQSEITQQPTPQSPAATSPIEHADPTTLAEVAQHVQRALVNGSDPLSLSAYKELFEPASKLPQVSEEKRISLLAPIFKAASQAQQPPAEQSPQIEISHESEKIEEAKPEIKRRIPLPSLRPRLDLCLPTNIALNAESRIVFVGSKHKAAEALLRKLRNRKVKLLSIQTDDPQEIQTQIQAFSQEGELQGVFFLAALDTEPPLGEMDYLAWQTELDHRLYTLEAILRAIPYQPNAAHQPFLVCATAMGGAFGYDVEGARSPLGGAVVGLAKAIARERQGWFVKVIDFSPNESSNFIAEKLIAETLQDNAVIEVGWKNNMRFGITLHEQPLPSSESTVSLSLADQTPVVLVSGGSGGITVPILLDLAKTVQAHFFLLSRTPLQEDDPDLILFKQIGRNALKQTLLQRAKESGVKVKPAEIERQIDVLERKAAAQAAVEALTQAGSQVTHLVCDVSQSESVEQTVQQVLSQAARVDVLIHAAGVERSRSLETKPTEEFHQIVAIKAGGFFNLYSALLKHQALPKVMIAFGSVAGRFGNSGQTDYSAANDLLSKLCSAIRKTHNIQAVCIDWGAWAEVGMASRGVIPELMRRAGIEMMSPNAAAPLLRQELLSGCPHSEVVYSGSLGILEQQADEAYGLDLEKANTALTEGKPIYEMITRLNSFTPQDGIYLEAELDPQEYPMLRDHAIRGIPVLPGVIGIEGFRIAARHIASTLASQKGSFLAQHLEDIQFLVPFKFYHNAPRRILWKAKALLEEKGLIAYATLESTRVRPNGEVDHRLHFKGKVFLTPTKEALQPVKTQPPHWNGAYTVSSDDIYRIYFHGPAFQVLEAVQRNNGHIIGKMHQQVLDYTKNPIPYLIELCLQTAGVWEIGLRGILALPNAIDQLTIYTNKLNGKAIFAQVFPQINGDSYTFDAQAIDAEGNLLVEMKGYRTIATEMSVDSDLILPLRKLME